jgi:hypothetical protein
VYPVGGYVQTINVLCAQSLATPQRFGRNFDNGRFAGEYANGSRPASLLGCSPQLALLLGRLRLQTLRVQITKRQAECAENFACCATGEAVK